MILASVMSAYSLLTNGPKLMAVDEVFGVVFLVELRIIENRQYGC
jgi:hypothetical protein